MDIINNFEKINTYMFDTEFLPKQNICYKQIKQPILSEKYILIKVNIRKY